MICLSCFSTFPFPPPSFMLIRPFSFLRLKGTISMPRHLPYASDLIAVPAPRAPFFHPNNKCCKPVGCQPSSSPSPFKHPHLMLPRPQSFVYRFLQPLMVLSSSLPRIPVPATNLAFILFTVYSSCSFPFFPLPSSSFSYRSTPLPYAYVPSSQAPGESNHTEPPSHQDQAYRYI